MLTIHEVVNQYPNISRNGLDWRYAESLDEMNMHTVWTVVDWLDTFTRVETPVVSSYSLKHVAEKSMRLAFENDPEIGDTLIARYVANGELIMAAAILEIPQKQIGINTLVAISKAEYMEARDMVGGFA